MSSSPIPLSKLVQQIPPFDNALDPYLRALISVLAEREKMKAGDWISLQLRVALQGMLVKHELPPPPSPFDEPSAEDDLVACPELPPPQWNPLPPERRQAALHQSVIHNGLQSMRSEVEALLAKRNIQLSELDRRRVPGNRRLRFYEGSIPGMSDKGDDDKVAWFKRLDALGNEREILRVRQSMIRSVKHLLVDAPNLREASEHVLRLLALARRDGDRLAIHPILLVGPPAAGKSWWAEQIARAIGVRSELVPMGGVSSSFELSGHSRSWNASRPGRILRAFVQSSNASPVFVLDEIDKASAGNYDPAPVLLNLAERDSARRFRDEFFDHEFDVSRSILIATANYPERMDPALRSRFHEIVVREPSREERLPIIASLWRDMRADHPALQLPVKLDPEVVSVLVDAFVGARQARRLMEDGLGRAAMRDGSMRLLPHDVVGQSSASVPFGFGPRP